MSRINLHNRFRTPDPYVHIGGTGETVALLDFDPIRPSPHILSFYLPNSSSPAVTITGEFIGLYFSNQFPRFLNINLVPINFLLLLSKSVDQISARKLSQV